LSRLRSFPVHKLKIDKSFIDEVRGTDDEAPIVSAIVAMAHSLHLTTVAEGVETFEQLACLSNHGVEEVQGYLVSKPLPLDEFERLLASYDDTGVADAIPASAPLSAEEVEYADVVEQLTSANGDLSRVMGSVLAELCRVTGADAAYLSEVMWDRGTEQIRFAHGDELIRLEGGEEDRWE